ncbi:efflux RND transporter periplasmic adaptor subunit [Albimonas sp. CAU 1670]|uniref:efflux RND transporter periplasmic adaptor subunit n=1 Tax=Albimonas sp. CAU 1670 TaxID=3032599 RepID=UPI0023DA9460|nr:efflux RND transporter periplasmic adaptor subunit [Albimonas sp. CAU 1670]MDF2235449.1 efflux RND transporter periplasmic adaptor subunit [Albimonas sp. CAU 1670]
MRIRLRTTGLRLAPAIWAAAALAAGALPAAAQGLEVSAREISDRRPVFGQVESVKRAVARARLTGELVELTVTEGDAVTAGQVIARVQDDKLALQIAALDAGIRALEAQQAQARIDLDRARELRDRGAVPAATLDQAQTAMNVVEETRAAREAERAALVQRRDEGAVLAPEGGRVLSVPVVQGMTVNPGETIAEIAAERFVLRARLPERHARFLGEGDTVRIAARGPLSGGEAGEGVIAKVYPELEAGQVVVDISAPDLGDFFVGERVRLEVATGVREAIVVPTDYLRLRHGVAFARLETGSGAVEVVVQPGGAVDGGVEVLAGLKPGDRLVAWEGAK